MSSYESLRAMGTSVVCLSPWGDSSPLLLPCIRFRDLAVHTVIVATGGMAAVAAPVMAPISEVAVATFGSTILVQLGLRGGFSLATKGANDLLISKPINKLIPIHSDVLETTGVKILTITLKFKLAMEDAALGFYRGSAHEDTSLFSSVMDYISVEKGWFSPYLFASARRPVIPRSMKPDVIFCHGPFLSGDYSIGETLLKESASVIHLCDPPKPAVEEKEKEDESFLDKLKIPALSNLFDRSRTPSPEPALAPVPPPPVPRRMVIVVVGLKPFRSMWSSSKRPEESVIKYILVNGCPSIVVPVKVGAPLLAWDTMTLEKLWDISLPVEGEEKSADGKFEGVVDTLCEYLDLCVDWDRVRVPESTEGTESDGEIEVVVSAEGGEDAKGTKGDGKSGLEPQVQLKDATLEEAKEALKDAITLLVAGAVRTKDSAEVKEEIDEDRSGIAMWRIP
ncbi:hypothetical protein CC2G_004007 [Coprinopsis cinerea AmutBmut pab1-1]|nr:hypothetical protein CC2G_004007 [Coprinopsis cinerea AmutBmut pab1-1]